LQNKYAAPATNQNRKFLHLKDKKNRQKAQLVEFQGRLEDFGNGNAIFFLIRYL
jgi:hypothetical protein